MKIDLCFMTENKKHFSYRNNKLLFVWVEVDTLLLIYCFATTDIGILVLI